MTIGDVTVDCLKQVGRNHLTSLAFAAAGFLSAFFAAKIATQIFKFRSQPIEPVRGITAHEFIPFSAGAMIGLQSCISFGKEMGLSSAMVDPGIGIIHLIAGSILWTMNQEKAVAVAALSLGSIVLGPGLFGAFGAAAGAFFGAYENRLSRESYRIRISNWFASR